MKHKWIIVFHNDRMGFIRTITVIPPDPSYSNHISAAELAYRELARMGYKTDEFAVISLTRGSEIR